MTASTPKAAPQPLDTKTRIKGIAGAATGNLVEYFDFYIYAYFAPYFQHTLMPPGSSETSGQLYVWGVFAASFLMRPIGSWIFGEVGDRFGRKRAMIASILLMGISSLMFACLPTYEQVGGLAPFLLLAVRLLQGLSVGGEYGMVATYLSEMSLKGRRGLMSSFQYVMLVGGQLLASLLALIASLTIDEQTMAHGGWRISFAIGGLAAFVSLWVRLRLEESLHAEAPSPEEKSSMRSLLSQHLRSFLLVAGLTGAGSITYYTLTVYSKTYFANIGISNDLITSIIPISLFVLMIVQPLFGHLSDKIGIRQSMLLFCGLSIVMIYPLYVWVFPAAHNRPAMLALALSLVMLVLALYTSISAPLKADLFPAHIRGLGVSFSYALGNAVFGGSAPYVALQFKQAGFENGFYFYAMLILAIGFFCAWQLPRQSMHIDREQDALEAAAARQTPR